MLLKKTLVNNRVARDDCLLGFASWRDSPCVFMRMHDTTVSLKSRLSKVCYILEAFIPLSVWKLS